MTRIMISILLVTITFITSSCQSGKRGAKVSNCFYSNINIDSIPTSYFEKLPESETSKMMDDYIQVSYYKHEYDAGDTNSIILLSDQNNHILYKIDEDGHITSQEKVTSKKDLKVKKLIQKLQNQKERFLERKCLVEGGTMSILIIQRYQNKTRNIEYYFESDGYECDVLDDKDKVNEGVVDLVKLLK